MGRLAKGLPMLFFRFQDLILLFGLFLYLPNALAALGDIGTFTSPAKTFSTASYWIEGKDGLIMIDTQFLPKEALQAVQAAETSSGKKVVAAIVLHPNPDKFNGTAALQERGIKVITSDSVKALIPEVHKIRLGWFFDEYSPDYPRDAASPEVFDIVPGAKSTQVSIAGLTLTIHVLGKGASGAHLVVQHADRVFVGDLINPTNHAWLELGLIGDWLARLNDISAMKPSYIYPGRGPAGGISLIDAQRAYLSDVRNWVRQERVENGGQALSFFAKLRLRTKIENAYPTLGYALFMRDGLAAVWANEFK
jgi:glyoxylase-like metal-dependent hydrolase (beta-lactamase superfamily II)